jgi:hypothetical protein
MHVSICTQSPCMHVIRCMHACDQAYACVHVIRCMHACMCADVACMHVAGVCMHVVGGWVSASMHAYVCGA